MIEFIYMKFICKFLNWLLFILNSQELKRFLFKFVIIGRPYNAEHEKTKQAAAKQSQLKTLEKGKTLQAKKEGKGVELVNEKFLF